MNRQRVLIMTVCRIQMDPNDLFPTKIFKDGKNYPGWTYAHLILPTLAKHNFFSGG